MRKLFVIAIFSFLLSNALEGPKKLYHQVLTQYNLTSYTAAGHHQKHIPALVQSQVTISNYCCRNTSRAQIGYRSFAEFKKFPLYQFPIDLSNGFNESILKPPCFTLA
jgi:hypothetical protein